MILHALSHSISESSYDSVIIIISSSLQEER